MGEWMMRQRLVRAVVFVAIAFGVAVGGAAAAGAVGVHVAVSDGMSWD
jgi:hypothetical protein